VPDKELGSQVQDSIGWKRSADINRVLFWHLEEVEWGVAHLQDDLSGVDEVHQELALRLWNVWCI
jgi:hypothetical protein